MSRNRQEILRDALEHFIVLEEHAQRDLSDQLVLDAICMRLSAGIEALATLESADRAELFGDEWKLMWGMRNRIAHGYLLVDAAMVRATVEQDVPRILRNMRKEL